MIKKKWVNDRKPSAAILFRKEFYKRLLYIGLCAIPIIIFADDTGSFRLVPLPFFLVGSYNLIIIIKLSVNIIDAFFPPKTAFELKPKPFDKYVYYFSTGLFFAAILSLLFEIRNLDNTIHGTNLFWQSGAIGIGLAVIMTTLLKFTNPSVYYESKRRYTVHFSLFIGLFFLSASTGSFINHHYADSSTFSKTYLIVRKFESGRRSKSHNIVLIIDNSEENFTISKDQYEKFYEGGKIELNIRKGSFGYDIVQEFKML